MPTRKYITREDRPVFLSTRMPRVVIDFLHLIVRLQPPGFTFATLQELQADIVTRFITDDPTTKGFAWRTPRVADRRRDPLSYRQINFQLPTTLAQEVDRACAQAGVARATWLYTATMYYVRHIAPPGAIRLSQ